MATHALGIFLDKLTDWKFCPPSDNLWTINFLLTPQSGGNNNPNSFTTLYENINKVNDSFAGTYSPLWKVTTPSEDKSFVETAQDKEIGFFLANDVSFNGNAVNIIDNQSNKSVSHTGWFSFGKTQNGREHNHAAKINFFKTNWDITEIFIDKWIAAVGQQGLIEDSSLPNIKSNIVITEYAASTPNKTGVWVPRKQITLYKAVPKSRGESKLTYEFDEAGAMKTSIVDFEFDAYKINYFSVGNTTSKRQTPKIPTISKR
jgi:hypothetical protein